MRIRVAGLGATLSIALASCDTRAFKGPLGYAADSAINGATLGRCDTVNVDLGFADARLPLRSCEIKRADTTVSLILDRDARALVLSHIVAVDSTRQRAFHDSIQFSVGNDYGAPVICPQSDNLAETQVRLWNTLDRQLVLKNWGVSQVVFELRADHPQCHTGG